MNITVYTTTTCPYCKQLKDYLTEKSVAFVEKLVDQDDAARDAMLAVSDGFMGVPFTVIEKEGQVEKVLGFDKGKLETILGVS